MKKQMLNYFPLFQKIMPEMFLYYLLNFCYFHMNIYNIYFHIHFPQDILVYIIYFLINQRKIEPLINPVFILILIFIFSSV